jgi:hypothetical protein
VEVARMMLSFAESMAANMGMQGDPDWIIKIGDYIVQECVEWEFTDDEKDQSSLNIVMPNPDFILNGKFKYGMDMTIRFGYQGNMSPEAYFMVAEIKRSYPGDKVMTITVTGKDESQKMSGGNNKGNQGKGDDKAQLDKNLKANGMTMAGDSKGADAGCKGPCYNESDIDLAYRWGNSMSAAGQMEAAGASGADGPTSPLDGEGSGNMEGSDVKRHDGLTQSISGDWSGDGKAGDRNKNRQNNHGGQHSQEMITGDLELRGCPTLRSKSNCILAGFGVEDNGAWYVKKCVHTMKGKGILTKAAVSRGGTGKGGVGGTSPMVMYANIWKKGEMYFGPRQTNGAAQATFIYGADEHVISFEAKEKPQPHRGGGEPKKGKGKGLLLKKRLTETSTDSDTDTGSIGH